MWCVQQTSSIFRETILTHNVTCQHLLIQPIDVTCEVAHSTIEQNISRKKVLEGTKFIIVIRSGVFFNFMLLRRRAFNFSSLTTTIFWSLERPIAQYSIKQTIGTFSVEICN